ncbi:MarC family protein [Candidatus Woesearchaeota archaeon]|nr:MarC family protein [Candidatus Woesearchaeota archaeon]
MFEPLLQLTILFLVIFDPFASLVIFLVATEKMSSSDRKQVANTAVGVAAAVSALFLLFGTTVLNLFNTSIKEFQVAGGIVLGILGVKMVLGYSLAKVEELKNSTGWAIASIIGTPLLTGPAAITAIIVSVNDYGRTVTTVALAIVLILTTILFYNAGRIDKVLGRTSIKVISTILGLITLSWGVKYVLSGLEI